MIVSTLDRLHDRFVRGTAYNVVKNQNPPMKLVTEHESSCTETVVLRFNLIVFISRKINAGVEFSTVKYSKILKLVKQVKLDMRLRKHMESLHSVYTGLTFFHDIARAV